MTQTCVCSGGLPGGQVCDDSGDKWGPCDCFGATTGADIQTSPDTDQSDVDSTDNTDNTDTPDGTDGTDKSESTDGTDGVDTSSASDSTDGTSGPDLPPCNQASDCPPNLPECTPQGVCVFCYPGQMYCNGNKSMKCNDDGMAWTLAEDCDLTGSVCNSVGVCESPCGGFAKLAGTNAGCDFYAVDLRNATEETPCKFLNAQDAQFAVITSNTSETANAQVTVTSPDGQTQVADIAPMSLHKFLLPSDFGLKGPGSSQTAYRVQSSIPIVAYQFNPLANVDVFSNDASVLLPVAQQGTEYRVLTWEHFTVGSKSFPAYFNVVGIIPEPTEVTVTVNAPTAAADGLPALKAGDSHTFKVAHGQVFSFETTSGDLTGSRITSKAPIMVFSGHTGTWTSTKCCADHLEQQLPPVTSWGSEFALSRSMERGSESDYLRIVTTNPDTVVKVTTSSAPGGFTLSGNVIKLQMSEHVHIKTSAPVMLAQFLASKNEIGTASEPCETAQDCGPAYVCEAFSSSSAVKTCQPKPCTNGTDCGPGFACSQDYNSPCKKQCKPIGDPAMILGVPVKQWQSEFVFLTPDSYVLDYINVVAKDSTTQVTLDGQPLPMNEFKPIANTGYKVYRSLVGDGTHTLQADQPVSLVVYGYDSAVSYGYPGGMGLKTLKP